MDELDGLQRWWEAANYLTVAQIYLADNPLLRHPLRAQHIKPRLLGHWGTSPGLTLIHAHLNRLIRRTGQEVLYVAGPGHGGPAMIANAYLDGTYSEVYPLVSRDEAGLKRLVRQFSTPGGVPSHVGPTTPGSIHEGGELGYSLNHAFGAAFDNPELLAVCVIGDGEAETGPLEGAWKGVRFLHPAHDGAVLPILHLNRYKISGPTVLGRAPMEDVVGLLRAHGYAPVVVAGDRPADVHRALADTLDAAHATIREIQSAAHRRVRQDRPLWPAIILDTPKGWTGPHNVDGVQVEGTFRSHQVPLAGVREDPAHLAALEAWLGSYRPDQHFSSDGRLIAELQALAPESPLRMSESPHAHGQRRHQLVLRDARTHTIDVPDPGRMRAETTRPLGDYLRDIYVDNPRRFRLFSPDETNSNRLGSVFEVENRSLMDARPDDDHVAPGGRVMEVLSEHNCEGWLEGYVLTGRHGLFATYEAFAMVSASMLVQHAKWLETASDIRWRKPVSSLNVLLTSTCWRNDHNGFSHQGPGLLDAMMPLRGAVVRAYLPPDANTLLSVAEHCLASSGYVNLIIADKQSHLQYLDADAAWEHAAAGIAEWVWAGTDHDERPDVILAAAGDVPTQEALAAADLLREHVPELRFRFVNVVDLMALAPQSEHPHGLDESRFTDLFGNTTDVVFAFHGYARSLHQLLHGRPEAARFHVHGYREQGSTTTPFDMVVLNGMSRYDLVLQTLRRTRRIPAGARALEAHCHEMLERHRLYVVEHLEDMPEIRDWTWR